MRVPYRPVEAKLHALTADRDRLPSGKQTLALTLTWVLYYFNNITVLIEECEISSIITVLLLVLQLQI